MRVILFLLSILIAIPWVCPTYGFTLGLAQGLIGTDPVESAHIQYKSLTDLLLGERVSSVVVVGLIPVEGGFFARHGLESAFLAGGTRVRLGGQGTSELTESSRTLRRYCEALIVAFPKMGGDVSVGVASHFGLEGRILFPSGFPGGYFAELGAVATEGFMTISFHVGIFAGK